MKFGPLGADILGIQRSVENELLAEIRHLKKRIDAQGALIATKDERVAELERKVAQLSKNSTTSSKSPSSDLGKGTRKYIRAPGKRMPGGQPGHPKHERMPFQFTKRQPRGAG